MFTISDTKFRKLVSEAIDSIPKKYANNIKNLAFVVENQPSPAQRAKLNLDPRHTLFGLYEGIPLTQRSSGYNLVLPDKITIFKLPIEASVNSLEQLAEQVKHTIWHEVAHYYGLDHFQINSLENK